MKLFSVVVVGLVVVVLLCMSRPCSAEGEQVQVQEHVQEQVVGNGLGLGSGLGSGPQEDSLTEAEQELEQVGGNGSGHEEGSLAKGGKRKGPGLDPFIPNLPLPSGKKCRQCAVWVGTPNRECVSTAAQWLQNNVYRGDDGFAIENSANNGGWIRYWRVQECGNGNGRTGQCLGGGTWTSSNTQQTKGKVHCKHQ